MAWTGVITNAGKALLSEWVAGTALTVTGAAAGTGTVSTAALVNQTALTDQKQTASIIGGSVVPQGRRIKLQLEAPETGYTLNQMGVFAKLEEGQSTMLALYQNADGISIPSAGEQETFTFTFYAVIATDNTGTMNLTIDTEAVVTQGTMETYVEEATEGKQDAITATGLLKGTEGAGGSVSVTAATAGADYQAPTQTLDEAESMTEADTIPVYSGEAGEHRRVTLETLKEALNIPRAVIRVTTSAGAAVVCTDGTTTLTGTGSTDFEPPNYGRWTVRATLGGITAETTVEVAGIVEYSADLKLTRSIAITTPPTKTAYYEGEAFVPAGMVVTATYADNTTENVTADCTASPGTIEAGTTAVTITYLRAGLTRTASVAVTVRRLTGITITTPPSKTTYQHGEAFAPAGMVVTASYHDGSTRAVTGWSYSPAGALTAGTTAVTVTYAEGGVTKTATQAITVINNLLSIAITTPPTKTAYFAGESFATAGMVVRASMADGTTKTVSGYTNSPSTMTAGTTAVTISYTENGVTKTATQAVTVTTVSTTLADNSWATIRAVSDAGAAANYWSVGDSKGITLNGAVGNTTFSNQAIDAFIIGINHNSGREGGNRIHFKIGKISGQQVALVDNGYGQNKTGAGWFHMNDTNTNEGGWKESSKRKILYGNTGTPASPPAGSLLAALPQELRSAMKSVTKYSDNTGGGSDTASYVTSTTDYLFDLAEFEFHGARTYANSAERTYQAQYSYYQAGNTKIHKKHNATGDAANTFCRSVTASYSSYFCLVYTDGSAGGDSAYYSYGMAPGFCV